MNTERYLLDRIDDLEKRLAKAEEQLKPANLVRVVMNTPFPEDANPYTYTLRSVLKLSDLPPER